MLQTRAADAPRGSSTNQITETSSQRRPQGQRFSWRFGRCPGRDPADLIPHGDEGGLNSCRRILPLPHCCVRLGQQSHIGKHRTCPLTIGRLQSMRPATVDGNEFRIAFSSTSLEANPGLPSRPCPQPAVAEPLAVDDGPRVPATMMSDVVFHSALRRLIYSNHMSTYYLSCSSLM